VQIGAQNLPGRPAGLALDASGDLYVANYGNSIPVYKNDYKTVIATLSAPNGAQGIAVAQNGVVGTVIGNQVTFYASGSTTPCASLSLPKVHQLYQGAFDAAANFYVTGQDSNYNGIVGVISGGCSATSFTLLSTSNSLGQFVYGIQVTRFGKIAIGDQGSNAIYEYDPPVNGALGQPVATTDLPSSTKAIYEFGFTAKGAFVFVASDSGIVAKCAYPSGGRLLQSVGQQQQLDNPTGLVVAAPG
jgi:hypothetical protein